MIQKKRNTILILSLLWGAFHTLSLQAQALELVPYTDGAQTLNGRITSNAGQDLPGVLILPAWQGIDDEAKQAALNLEKQGYIAFIADIYGEGHIPEDKQAAAKISGKFKKDYKAYQKRIGLALETLIKQGAQKDKIAIIGYCFGGTGALEAARAQLAVQGVVSIHGGLDKASDRPHTPLKTKILIENPADDPGVTKAVYEALVKEMDEGGADWQIITYAHSGHTFTDPQSPEYNEIMAKRAWKHTLVFLEEVLQNK